MKEAVKTMWSKPFRTIFLFGGIGWVICKIIKVCKRKKS